jgi:hypothetical protein
MFDVKNRDCSGSRGKDGKSVTPGRYVETMDRRGLSTDQLERRMLDRRALVARLAAEDFADLNEIDRRQVATGDGCKSLSEWVAARFDLGLDTARRMVRTMRRAAGRPDLTCALSDGVSFDRVEALSRTPEDVGLLEHMDVGGVRREAARRARISAADERRSARDRFLVMQPSLDESWWKVWGGLDGPSGSLVDKVLTEKGDDLPIIPDGATGDGSWRKATALVEVCSNGGMPPAQVTVFVDATEAAGTGGQAGVTLGSGPRVGAEALQAVLCDAVTEVIALTHDGRPLEYGRSSRTVPPRLRRVILHRDGGVCAADGCDSRYRLEAHHVVPWSRGGTTDPENLTTLCCHINSTGPLRIRELDRSNICELSPSRRCARTRFSAGPTSRTREDPLP